MTYYDYLCALLEPMRIYRTERGSISGGELYAAGQALDGALARMDYAERESILPLAEGEGLARREKLFSRCPVHASTALRREAIAALGRISADSFTLDAINSTLGGCGCDVTRSVSKMTEIERRGGKRWDKPKKAGKSRDCRGGKF